jgi:hypothetical protein
MKTILVSIYDSNVARNILRTDVLACLREAADTRVVVLVPESKFGAYAREFSSPAVVVDALPRTSPTLLESVAINVARFSIPTHTVRQNAEKARLHGGVASLPKYAAVRLLSSAARFALWRRIIRRICAAAIRDAVFEPLFEKYTPDLVFSATVYDASDFRLLKYAAGVGVRSIGMIKSWDNLTSKDFLLIHPDRLIVHNELIRDDAITYGLYPADRIFVSGIPQFDVYTRDGFNMEREEFFSTQRLDPNKKLIVYAAVGSWLFRKESEAIRMLSDIISSGELGYPAQLYVRLHPAYTSDDESIKTLPNTVVFRPGKVDPAKPGLRSAWEFDVEETRTLAATLRHADVTINCGSTMSIEAAFFDAPIINLDFDGEVNDPYWLSVRRMYRREHYLPLQRSGGIRFPKNRRELVADLRAYLADRSLDSDGRERIVREECVSRDGLAGKRIAEYILRNV